MRRKLSINPTNTVIGTILVLISITCVLPFVYITAVSFSGELAIITNRVRFLPVDFQTAAYGSVFRNREIFRSFGNSLYVTLLGTSINIFVTAITAFPLSRKNLKGRKFFMSMIVFTMMFNGGMIPTYLVIKNLNLIDTFWALMLPVAISTFNLIILRTFFMSIPSELDDAALMDGCHSLRLLFHIYVPLSVTVLVTLILFYMVGHWNSFTNAIIYINDSKKYTLQVRLRQLIVEDQFSQSEPVLNSGDEGNVVQESLKSAVIIVSTVPILVVYPWLQKYFVKGVMIGAIKG